MSVHVEWLDADHPFTGWELLQRGTEVGENDVTGVIALAFGDGCDSCTVIEGTHESLKSLLSRALAAVIHDEDQKAGLVT
jgi:hypothetical protein